MKCASRTNQVLTLSTQYSHFVLISHTWCYLPSMVKEHSLPTRVLQRVYWESKEIIVLLPSYNRKPETLSLGRNTVLHHFVAIEKALMSIPHALLVTTQALFNYRELRIKKVIQALSPFFFFFF